MGSTSAPRLGEFALIAKLFAPLAARSEGAFGLRDDVATLRVPEGHELVAKVDAVVEGVHFLRDDPPELIAKKALRVNLSDLAAKGARAAGYLLSLSVAPWCGDDWLARFAAGLADDQQRYDVGLLGGDTTATPGALTLSITALGTVEAGRTIRRAGAKPGDAVFVSGSIGDAGAGLAILKGESAGAAAPIKDALIARYRLPEPRVALGPRLLGLARAALDVSDGLLADLNHIAEVSQVRVVIEASRVPLSPALKAVWGSGLDSVLRASQAGDDYEIVFTAPALARDAIMAAARDTGTPVQEIGRIESGNGLVLLDERGEAIALDKLGFTHF